MGSQPHPFTPRTWWRAPTGFGVFPYLCQRLAGVGRGIAFVSTEAGGTPAAPPGPRCVLGHGGLGLMGWRLRGEMAPGTPHSSRAVPTSRSVPGPVVLPSVGSASPLEVWPRRDSTRGPGCLPKHVEGGRRGRASPCISDSVHPWDRELGSVWTQRQVRQWPPGLSSWGHQTVHTKSRQQRRGLSVGRAPRSSGSLPGLSPATACPSHSAPGSGPKPPSIPGAFSCPACLHQGLCVEDGLWL